MDLIIKSTYKSKYIHTTSTTKTQIFNTKHSPSVTAGVEVVLEDIEEDVEEGVIFGISIRKKRILMR